MSFSINGDNQVIELESERSYSARDGWRTVRRWRGTKQAVNDFLPAVLVDGQSIRVIPDEGPLATLEAWFDNAQDGSDVSDAAQIVTTWSVVSNELEQSVLESDYFDALDGAEKNALRDYSDATVSYAEALAVVASSEGLALLHQMNAGKIGYAISQIVLRQTRAISGFDSALAYLSNANRVYSRAQLIAAFAPPTGVQSEMPSAGEWLARNGTKEQQSNGKWIVTREWWHGDRISAVYPRVA